MILASWGVEEGAVSASAFVADIVEEGGTCTIHVESGGATTSASRDAVPTGQNTSCGFLTVARDEVGDPPWDVWITYESATFAGTSDQVSLTEEDAR